MDGSNQLARGREAFVRQAWSDAHARLSQADRESPLEAADLDRLATAAFLIGDEATSTDAWTRAHQAFLNSGETIRAARSAYWLAFVMLDSPSLQAQASGWLARAQRLIDESATECAEQGLLLCAAALFRVRARDMAGAARLLHQAADVGERLKDRDVLAFARHGQGRVLIANNKAAEGLAMLDEVMVGITCGEVHPIIAGVVYCSVLSACHDLFDLRRGKEWTSALGAWCDAHPDMVPFRGECMVRRSEMLQLQGAWEDALSEAEQACARVDRRGDTLHAGVSNYQLAELHRLRGDVQHAEHAYRRASQAGQNPQPGLALLRLAQGQFDAALHAIRQQMQEKRGPAAHAHTLRAAVDVLLAVKDLAGARSAANELAQMAAELDAPFLLAASAHANGSVTFAEGDVATALSMFREAAAIWRELDAPYELARSRELSGIAYRHVGDEEGAHLELEAAADTYERLGARPDAARVASLLSQSARDAGGPLTGRELEVLRLIASGRTNRAIASELAISEKTVARHVSNILTKLDLPSRSAATAYAFSRNLVS